MEVAARSTEWVSKIASAIGEPARARMLFCLMDNRARTSTELAIVAEVSPSTASAHLKRLKEERLVVVQVQGKNRYYSLEGGDVANALEALSVVAGNRYVPFVSSTPIRLLTARTCYDHVAGQLGVSLHDRLLALGYLSLASHADKSSYDLTPNGIAAFEGLGMEINEIRGLRRRFAYGCLDWSERRPHLGGAIGAALLKLALKKGWVTPHLDTRALSLTRQGRRAMLTHFGLSIS